jgi:hypothetical protein
MKLIIKRTTLFKVAHFYWNKEYKKTKNNIEMNLFSNIINGVGDVCQIYFENNNSYINDIKEVMNSNKH